MRAFDLVRAEDLTGISGTGRVAEGCVFDDGHVVMRWLTTHRSTTFFPNIETVQLIHGHEGRTKIVFREGTELVVLGKPHLQLGNEGPYADPSVYDQCGAAPALAGAREAYDRLGKIEVPPGWTGWACWYVHGAVSLKLSSPKTYVRTHEVEHEGRKASWVYYDQQDVQLSVTRDVLDPSKPYVENLTYDYGRPGAVVRVAGLEYVAQHSEYSTTT